MLQYNNVNIDEKPHELMKKGSTCLSYSYELFETKNYVGMDGQTADLLSQCNSFGASPRLNIRSKIKNVTFEVAYTTL
jgi:hypothetical protein